MKTSSWEHFVDCFGYGKCFTRASSSCDSPVLTFFPDYQERIFAHEAAPFLVAYLIGLPILGYSLDIGKEHVNLIDERLTKLIYNGQLDSKKLDRLSAVAMAGLAAEGLKYDKIIGQSADLFSLQRFINRSKPKSATTISTRRFCIYSVILRRC